MHAGKFTSAAKSLRQIAIKHIWVNDIFC